MIPVEGVDLAYIRDDPGELHLDRHGRCTIALNCTVVLYKGVTVGHYFAEFTMWTSGRPVSRASII